MVWNWCVSLRLFCPAFADKLIWREGLESLGEVVGCHEVGEVLAQLIVGFVVEAFGRCFLERALHSLDLAVGQRCFGLFVR